MHLSPIVLHPSCAAQGITNDFTPLNFSPQNFSAMKISLKTLLLLVVLQCGTLSASAQWSAEAQVRSMAGWGDSKELGLRTELKLGFFANVRAAATVDYGFMSSRESALAALVGVGWAHDFGAIVTGAQIDFRFNDINSGLSNTPIPWTLPLVYVGYDFRFWQLQVSAGWPYAVGAGVQIPLPL